MVWTPVAYFGGVIPAFRVASLQIYIRRENASAASRPTSSTSMGGWSESCITKPAMGKTLKTSVPVIQVLFCEQGFTRIGYERKSVLSLCVQGLQQSRKVACGHCSLLPCNHQKLIVALSVVAVSDTLQANVLEMNSSIMFLVPEVQKKRWSSIKIMPPSLPRPKSAPKMPAL